MYIYILQLQTVQNLVELHAQVWLERGCGPNTLQLQLWQRLLPNHLNTSMILKSTSCQPKPNGGTCWDM